MKPPPFDYQAAGSVAEAVALLARAGDEARLLAGGQSLLPMLNFRLLAPALLVDVGGLAELAYVAADGGGGLRIGAMTRHVDLERAPPVRQRYPVLAAAMGHVAHLAIRNRGTIGGSLCHADPAAELPMMALLLEAQIAATGPAGARRIAARDFFNGALATALSPDEMVTEIVLPAPPEGAGWGFEEVARRSGDFALAGAAALATVRDGAIGSVRLAVMGVAETPLRLHDVEPLLAGRAWDGALAAAVAEAVRGAIDPDGDLHASAGYRRHLAGVLAVRALAAAWRRAQGEPV